MKSVGYILLSLFLCPFIQAMERESEYVGGKTEEKAETEIFQLIDKIIREEQVLNSFFSQITHRNVSVEILQDLHNKYVRLAEKIKTLLFELNKYKMFQQSFLPPNMRMLLQSVETKITELQERINKLSE